MNLVPWPNQPRPSTPSPLCADGESHPSLRPDRAYSLDKAAAALELMIRHQASESFEPRIGIRTGRAGMGRVILQARGRSLHHERRRQTNRQDTA